MDEGVMGSYEEMAIRAVRCSFQHRAFKPPERADSGPSCRPVAARKTGEKSHAIMRREAAGDLTVSNSPAIFHGAPSDQAGIEGLDTLRVVAVEVLRPPSQGIRKARIRGDQAEIP